MVTTLTVSLEELVIEEYPVESLLVTLQIQNKSVKFTAPFSDLKIKLPGLHSDDFLFILFSTKAEEIGQAQISLENLSESKEYEKQVSLTRISRSPEKNATQKMMNIGKFKLIIRVEDEDVESFGGGFGAVVEVYNEIKEVLQNIWDISVPEKPDIENLGLAVINNPKYLKKTDFEHVKVLAVGLNEKLKVIPLLQRQLEDSLQTSSKYFIMHGAVLLQLEKAKIDFEQVNLKQTEASDKTFKELQSVIHENSEIKALNRELQFKLDKLQSEFLFLQNQSSADSIKASANQSLENLVIQLQQQIHDLETSRAVLQQDLHNAINETSNLSEAFSSTSESLQALLDEKSAQILSLSSQHELQQSTISTQSSEILSLNMQLENYHKQILAYSDLEDNFHSIQMNYSSLQAKFTEFQNSLKAHTEAFDQEKSRLSEEKEKLCDHSRDIQKENMKLQSSVLKFSTELNSSKTAQSALASELAVAQQLIKHSEDLETLSKTLAKIHEQSEARSDELYKELEYVSSYLLGQSEHNLQNIRTLNKIYSTSLDKENENFMLRDMISDLQRRRAVYFPARDDAIDTAIADFVNTRGTDVPFTREDQGIYVFGSKRVFVKLENGRVVSI